MTHRRNTGGYEPVTGYYLNNVTDRDRLYLQFDLFFDSFRSEFDRVLHLGGIDSNPDTANFRILDVGCGEAMHLADIVTRYPKVQAVGIDRDDEAITTARGAFAGNGDAHFYLHDAHRPFPAEWEPGIAGSGFDIAQLRYVICHVKAKVVLANVNAALRPGGMLSVMDPLAKMLEFPHPSLRWLAEVSNEVWRRLGTFDAGLRYHELLTEAGFEVLEANIQRHEMGGPTSRGWAFLTLCVNLFVSARRVMVEQAKVVSGEEYDMHLERLRNECTPQMVGQWSVGQAIARKPL